MHGQNAVYCRCIEPPDQIAHSASIPMAAQAFSTEITTLLTITDTHAGWAAVCATV